MKVTIFSTHRFELPFLNHANESCGHVLHFLEARLNEKTADLAADSPAVAGFAGDDFSAPVLEKLSAGGTRLIALRSAGFNHVDVTAAESLGFTVARVPAYSPYAIAEHTVGLILTLNRKLHRAIPRVRDQNFQLDGLLGFDLHGRTVGIVGTGKIGTVFAKIMAGFGCRLIGVDRLESPGCLELGMRYVALDELARESDIISLHCPLTPDTHHLIDESFLAQTKRGVYLVNTSRGAVIDTRAAIQALKSGHLGALALDVYEEEGDLFFHDLSDQVITDDVFARLLTFPNVVVTAHQAFFTSDALRNIAETTLQNVTDFAAGQVKPENLVTTAFIKGKQR
ncbi:MAG: 2-hydroxyacid dehydrogenase [Phycisphaerae bacterium]